VKHEGKKSGAGDAFGAILYFRGKPYVQNGNSNVTEDVNLLRAPSSITPTSL
jgi:hypothetical protein